MYNKVDNNLNFVQREKIIEQFWKDNNIFQKSIEMREGAPVYSFYDGPPTANGKPHIGHVLTRVIKDMIPRYRTMKGYKVPRKAGWDTHGLPVELEVEKLLGLDGKEQIEEYGLEPFIAHCKESVWKYKGMWEDFSSTVGFWADMDDPYVTYHNDFIESEWWALKQIWEKGLLYKGFKIVPYCPRCGTPLSSHEVAQGYKSVKERFDALDVQYKDLTTAEADLRTLIDELVTTMENEFRRQFTKIQENFASTFSELFGGGRAELVLSDKNDILNCNIDIIAQPPGKKLQLLSLLSGGERALTAIALLFAILKLKPTAFCILDEIETSLDEVNVSTVAKYVQHYSKDTQFIMITHRKGSMEVCNALYGVAMEEKGISKVVSARFNA